MAHHGDFPFPKELMGRFFNPDFKQPELQPVKLGPTKKFPEGKLCDGDQGEIKMAIGLEIDTKGNPKVVINFGEKPVNWIGFTPEQARQIALSLLEKATDALVYKTDK